MSDGVIVDLRFSPEEEAFRAEACAWLETAVERTRAGVTGAGEVLDREVQLQRAWDRALYEGGWAGINWPKAYGGRGASPVQHMLFMEEAMRADAPQELNRLGKNLLGPTLIAHGTDQQKARYLPRILDGSEVWCQGFSEPEAGSDLASLRTVAEPDTGGGWRVTGQKVWTSLAHYANRCFVLARTDRHAPKHRGISFFLLDMQQTGVTVRPLRQSNGSAEFCEVFFDAARVEPGDLVGELNRGWQVTGTTLGYERATIAFGRQVLFARQLRALHTAAAMRGPIDPLHQQVFARLDGDIAALGLFLYRVASRLEAGDAPGPESSVIKLHWSETWRRMGDLAAQILGPQIAFGTAKGPVDWAWLALTSRSRTIAGGTSEIQRNIVAERVLDLPRT
jgi:alkylation response protein AidB-like acyl-CoA dehydrogenase